MYVSVRDVVEIILDGSQWLARFEVKCILVSSNKRMHPLEDVGNNRRRDDASACSSSGRHTSELYDETD